MPPEQSLIEHLYHTQTIPTELFHTSHILPYYAGLLAKQNNDLVQAEQYFQRAITLNPLFSLPVFELANIYLTRSPPDPVAAHKLLLTIFDKPTLDPMSLTGDYLYKVDENLKICALTNDPVLKQKMITRFKARGLLTCTDLVGWKTLCLELGDAYPDKATEYYHLGLDPAQSALLPNKDYDTELAKTTEEQTKVRILNEQLKERLGSGAALPQALPPPSPPAPSAPAPKTLLLQGWFDVPHSYAIVALNTLAALVKANAFTKIYIQQVPYHNYDWSPVSQDELVSPAVKELIALARPWPMTPSQPPPSVVLRIACNHELIDHSLFPNVPTYWFYTAEAQRFDNNLEQDFLQYCAQGKIIPVTPSQWSAAALPVKSIVIPHGVDPDLFNTRIQPTKQSTIRSQWLGGVSGCVFLNVGAMTQNKNVGGILKGFYDLVVSGADCYLIMKGLENLYTNRHQAIKECLQHKIATGAIQQDIWDQTVKKRIKIYYQKMPISDLADLYKACDIYVSPYFAEGFNLPVLEALACGLDVVVSGGGPVTEWGIPSEKCVYIPGSVSACAHGNVFISSDEAISSAMLQSYNNWLQKKDTPRTSFSFTWDTVTQELIKQMTEVKEDIITGKGLAEAAQAHGSGVTYLPGDEALFYLTQTVPTLSQKTTLIIHNSDQVIDQQRYQTLLSHPNINACFAQNATFYHPKLFPLPIGIANPQWPHGDTAALRTVLATPIKQTKLCYLGFDTRTNPSKREACKRLLSTRFPWRAKQATYTEYLTLLKSCQFCICPEGNGPDTHRFWECLYLGVVPVVLREHADKLIHHRRNALIVDTWNDVTELFLVNATKPPLQTSLSLSHYSQWIQLKATTPLTAVLIHLGEQVPEYLEDCIEMCLERGMKVMVYLDASTLPEWLNTHTIQLVRPDHLTPAKDPSYTTFLASHPFYQNDDMLHFRNGFYNKCLERFFVLHRLIDHFQLTDVIHLENDVLLYQDPWQILPTLRTKEIASVFMNEKRCVPGFFYVRDSQAMKRVCEFMATSQENDMDTLGNYARMYPARVLKLPRLPKEMLAWQGAIPCLFDAAPIGQFLGGPDPRNGAGGPGFINPDADYQVDTWTIQWTPEGPYCTGDGVPGASAKIGMLHVHCKNLKAFRQRSHSQPPAYQFETLDL